MSVRVGHGLRLVPIRPSGGGSPALAGHRRSSPWLTAVAVAVAAFLTIAVSPEAAPASGAVAFHADADAQVVSTTPNRNFGSTTAMRANASPDKRSYVRFNVTGVTTSVTKATFRIYAVDRSPSGYNVRAAGRSAWRESTITYGNAPRLGSTVATTPAHPSGAWASADVTRHVGGNGTYTFAITRRGGGDVRYATRESTRKPKLLVEMAPARDTEAPVAVIAAPADGTPVSGVVSVTGQARDNASVSRVDLHIDGGPAHPATGTTTWTASTDTRTMSAGSHVVTARVTDTSGNVGTASVTVIVSASVVGAAKRQALLERRDLIYGTEIGAWKTDGRPAVDPASGIPALVQAAKIPVVRFAMFDVFSDQKDPLGNAGTQSRTAFNAALDGIRGNLKAEVFFKLLPIAPDVIGTKNGTIYCPRLDDLTSNLEYYKAVLREAGSRVTIYESSNEMEYTCAKLWGFSSAGAAGVSTVLGKHFAQNMPALRKYARSLGFDIVTVGYVGTPGGFGWGDTITKPRIRTATEFLTATHDAYVAAGKDPDYVPDAISVHAYPYSPDFGYDAQLGDIIAYYEAWAKGVRAESTRIWGPEIGPKIKLVVSEWNAGNSGWSGFADGRAGQFYKAWLEMLRRNDFWMANQFLIASHSSSPYDMIRTNAATTSYYDVFKTVSLSDPLR